MRGGIFLPFHRAVPALSPEEHDWATEWRAQQGGSRLTVRDGGVADEGWIVRGTANDGSRGQRKWCRGSAFRAGEGWGGGMDSCADRRPRSKARKLVDWGEERGEKWEAGKEEWLSRPPG